MLRTVSFSDKRVADLVNSKFVAAWTDRGPGFVNAEFSTEAGITLHNYEMYPTKNICTFFLTPDRKVFYYVAGSYAPEVFLSILETAASLRKVLFDERMDVTPKGLALAAEVHLDRADTHESRKDEAERGEGWRALVKDIRPGSYRGLKHVHGPQCGWSLKEGYGYLSALHREWAQRTELPEFDQVRYKYLYGNDFTEESAGAPHISRPETSDRPIAKRLRALKVGAEGPKDPYGINLPALRLFGE